MGKVCFLFTFQLLSSHSLLHSLHSDPYLERLLWLKAMLLTWWSILGSHLSELLMTFDTTDHSLFLNILLSLVFLYFELVFLLFSWSLAFSLAFSGSFPQPSLDGPLVFKLISFPPPHTFFGISHFMSLNTTKDFQIYIPTPHLCPDWQIQVSLTFPPGLIIEVSNSTGPVQNSIASFSTCVPSAA